MSWSAEFLREMRRRSVAPLFLLEEHRHGSEGRPPAPLLASFDAPGVEPVIMSENTSVEYGELRPGTFERSADVLSVGLAKDPRRFVKRGALWQLRVGFQGWDLDDFEPVFTGRVRSCSLRQGRWVVTFVDLAGSLTSRVKSPSLGGIFTNQTDLLGRSTLTDALLTSESVAELDDAVVVESETGQAAVYIVEPANDDPFYVAGVMTNGTADTITGLVAGSLFGTTRVNAAVGDGFRTVAYIEDHPLLVARKILVSTGTGAHGAYDTLPAAWGLGLTLPLIDGADIDQHVALCSPASGDPWILLQETAQDDPMSFLTSWLAPGGMWLGMRQGRLTVRGLVGLRSRTVDPEHVITDDDLVEPPEYDLWDPTLPVEYLFVRVYDLSGGDAEYSENHLEAPPVIPYRDIDLPVAAGSDWREFVAQRVGQFFLRVPERLKVRLAGFRLAHLCAGDVVHVSSRFLDSVYAGRGYSFASRRLLVLGGGPDWFGGTTELLLCAPVPVDGAP